MKTLKFILGLFFLTLIVACSTENMSVDQEIKEETTVVDHVGNEHLVKVNGITTIDGYMRYPKDAPFEDHYFDSVTGKRVINGYEANPYQVIVTITTSDDLDHPNDPMYGYVTTTIDVPALGIEGERYTCKRKLCLWCSKTDDPSFGDGCKCQAWLHPDSECIRQENPV